MLDITLTTSTARRQLGKHGEDKAAVPDYIPLILLKSTTDEFAEPSGMLFYGSLRIREVPLDRRVAIDAALSR